MEESMTENMAAPSALTMEQKLVVRTCQAKLSKIETQKISLQAQFEKLVAEEKRLVDELQKYFNENVQSKDGYALNDNLEWVETPKPE